MAQTFDIDSQEFQQLLAESLRAGPASPSWRQAVDALKAAGESGEELALLCKARERLESGRAYRSVRAGTGFTRKLMSRLDQTEQNSGSRIPTASLITALAAIVILSVVGGLAWMLFSPATDTEGKVDLRSLYFVNTSLAQDFDQKLPEGWQPIGSIPLVADRGLRVSPANGPLQHAAGGGLLGPGELSPRQPCMIETTLDVGPKGSTGIAEVFVSETPEFSSDRGVSPRELVWQISGRHSRVALPDGRGVASSSVNPSADHPVTVRILLSRDKCIIEQDGTVVWTGEHELSQEKSRRFGVRLLSRPDARPTDIAIRSVRILKP